MSAQRQVKIVCPNPQHAKHGTSWMLGKLSCPWVCESCGGKCGANPLSVSATLAPGQREQLLREAVEGMVAEFEDTWARAYNAHVRSNAIDWWRAKLSALGVSGGEHG